MATSCSSLPRLSRRTGLPALALAAAVALLAGCGSTVANSSGGASGAGTPPPTGSGSSSSAPGGSGGSGGSGGHSGASKLPPAPHLPTAIPPARYVKKVVVQRSGGLSGGHLQLVFTSDTAPHHNQRVANAVLKAAADPSLRGLRYADKSPVCCDHYRYTVTVTWADGVSRSFPVRDAHLAPAPLAEVLSLALSA